MLKLKHHFHLPEITFGVHAPLELAPVSLDDDDELAQAIAADPFDHDNNWSLEERPDTSELESFWKNVESDLKSDPEWVDFGREEA